MNKYHLNVIEGTKEEIEKKINSYLVPRHPYKVGAIFDPSPVSESVSDQLNKCLMGNNKIKCGYCGSITGAIAYTYEYIFPIKIIGKQLE